MPTILAASHLVPNPFNPRTSGLPGQMTLIKLIPLKQRSPSNSVPMDKWSQKIWSPWTNRPKPIWSPYSLMPTACPSWQMEYSRDHLSRGIEFLSMETKLVGDCLSRGTNHLGTKCSGTICVWDQMCHSPILPLPPDFPTAQ